jgi:pSer/pThr/pTyr-binding forkhead associated (FHA) protein
LNGSVSLGREAGNDVPLLGDQMASRRHAQVVGSNGAYILRDEGSSNGTFLNGARITEATLHSGDELTIGQSRFRFEQ